MPTSCSSSSRTRVSSIVDVRFVDLPGIEQHFTVPASSFDADVFDNGLAFDGSSIRGFQAINESDMALFPDPTTAFLDPFRARQDAGLSFFIHDPITGEAYSPRPAQHRAQGADLPRHHRHRGHGVLRARGGVLHLRLGPLLHRRQRGLLPHRLRARLLELRPERRQPRLQDPFKGGYFPVAPYDHYGDLRDEMVKTSRPRAARSSARTTRSARPARPRSTTGSTPCSRPPTT